MHSVIMHEWMRHIGNFLGVMKVHMGKETVSHVMRHGNKPSTFVHNSTPVQQTTGCDCLSSLNLR